jgi:hypothetical protein
MRVVHVSKGRFDAGRHPLVRKRLEDAQRLMRRSARWRD